MARVREIAPSELPSDLASIYEKYTETYGPFGAQVAVIRAVKRDKGPARRRAFC
jgi:hypothetical protein